MTHPAGDLQVAADRTSIDSLRGPLVSSLLAFVARRRRVAEGTVLGSRPHDGMAVGATLWSRIGAADATTPQVDQ